MPDRKNVLKIRCSDGRSRKPPEIRGCFVHQIRLPGGILFPDLCAQQFSNPWKRAVVSKLLRIAFMYAIKVMIRLKSPETIYLMSHNYCGAAEAIAVSDEQMKQAHVEYGKMLQRRFPTIPVVVMHEGHSECGEHHDGHEVLLQKAA